MSEFQSRDGGADADRPSANGPSGASSGSRWGRLELDGFEDAEVIGSGGFGVVYRAHELAFGRTVAVKVLTSGGLDETTRGRFERECQAMGAVAGHPNIVTVYASGFDDLGRPYLAMDYMAGGSLAQRLRTAGPFEWQDAVAIGVKLAGALATAHGAGILHRDVKLENVLISAYDEPKLADFGISRIPGGFETRSGAISATPLHAAPEVLWGQGAGEASDVYSLGSSLFTLITGTPAFARDDVDETMFALMHRVADEPLPDLRTRGVPGEVAEVIERSMAKKPEHRPLSAAVFGQELQEAQRRLGLAPTEMQAPAAGAARRATTDPRPSYPPTPVSSGWSTKAPPAPAGPAVVAGGLPPAPADDDQPERRRPRAWRLGLVALLILLVAGSATLVTIRGDEDERTALATAERATTSTTGQESPATSAATLPPEPEATGAAAPPVSARPPPAPATDSPTPAAPPRVAPEPRTSPAPVDTPPPPAATGTTLKSPDPTPETSDGAVQEVTTAVGGGSGTSDGGFPTAAEQALLNHISSSLTCFRNELFRPAGATASVRCESTTGEFAVYNQFANVFDMRSAYELERQQEVGITDSGNCEFDRVAESSYSDAEGQDGRLMCYLKEGRSWIEWTSERLGIYTYAYRNDESDAALFRWWQDFGGPY